MPTPSPLFPSDGASTPFDALVRAHYGRLCNFAYRFVHSRDVAEDLVQDVFARLWRQREEFDLQAPLPYLYQAVRNNAVSYRRQQGVREEWRARETDLAFDRPDAPSAADELEAAELATLLARAVDELPERCRLVFTMSREQDLTYTEIAKALGISIKTVETQMGRALRIIRTRLAGYASVAIAALTARIAL